MRGPCQRPVLPRVPGGDQKSTQRESKARAARKRRKDPPERKPTLGQIAAKARSLHMSYGEFVAKYGI